jgi:hypothetical protein
MTLSLDPKHCVWDLGLEMTPPPLSSLTYLLATSPFAADYLHSSLAVRTRTIKIIQHGTANMTLFLDPILSTLCVGFGPGNDPPPPLPLTPLLATSPFAADYLHSSLAVRTRTIKIIQHGTANIFLMIYGILHCPSLVQRIFFFALGCFPPDFWQSSPKLTDLFKTFQ